MLILIFDFIMKMLDMKIYIWTCIGKIWTKSKIMKSDLPEGVEEMWHAGEGTFLLICFHMCFIGECMRGRYIKTFSEKKHDIRLITVDSVHRKSADGNESRAYFCMHEPEKTS